jgi:hypothetical protein
MCFITTPTELPMLPHQMPYYWRPQIPVQIDFVHEDTDVAYCQSLLASIVGWDGTGLCHLSHVPFRFSELDTIIPAGAHASTNHKIPCFAQQILPYSWVVCSFGGGHFASMMTSCNLPFCVKLACDQYESGCALFCEFTMWNKMLDYISGSGDTSQVHV